MLIRSQDKNNLVVLENLTNISAPDREIIAGLVAERDDYIRLGCYSSHGKALKVLDKILGVYDSSSVCHGILVFQMPQDKEVEG